MDPDVVSEECDPLEKEIIYMTNPNQSSFDDPSTYNEADPIDPFQQAGRTGTLTATPDPMSSE